MSASAQPGADAVVELDRELDRRHAAEVRVVQRRPRARLHPRRLARDARDRVDRMAEQVAVVQLRASAERAHRLAQLGLDERVDDDRRRAPSSGRRRAAGRRRSRPADAGSRGTPDRGTAPRAPARDAVPSRRWSRRSCAARPRAPAQPTRVDALAFRREPDRALGRRRAAPRRQGRDGRRLAAARPRGRHGRRRRQPRAGRAGQAADAAPLARRLGGDLLRARRLGSRLAGRRGARGAPRRLRHPPRRRARAHLRRRPRRARLPRLRHEASDRDRLAAAIAARSGSAGRGSRAASTTRGTIEAQAPPLAYGEPQPRPANIVNVDEVEHERRGATATAPLATAGALGSGRASTGSGSTPASAGSPPHCHSEEEEMFVILDGSAHARALAVAARRSDGARARGHRRCARVT